MAPTHKLTYFNTKGVSEPIRLLFKYGNIDFEDVRVDKEKDWPKLKEVAPFGQLPFLEYNGKRSNQSVAICRYVGRLVKLAGNNEWEDLEIDAVVDTFNDMKKSYHAVRMEEDESKRQAIKDKIFNETIPYYLSRLDAMAQKNQGYLAVGRLTWADIYFVGTIHNIEKIYGGDLFDKYKNLRSLIDKVNSLPPIKKWIAERPQTD